MRFDNEIAHACSLAAADERAVPTSRHACVRARQRSVSKIVIELLQRFGDAQFDGHGGVVRYFGGKSRRKLERSFGRSFVAENEKCLRRYLVESAEDGTVITAGVRFKRIRRR